jgi:hypothetical protein
MRLWDRYMRKADNRGVTLMWHALGSRCSVEADLLPKLQEAGLLSELMYLYMPTDADHPSRANRAREPRAKGYAFVHFPPRAAQAMQEQALDVTGKRATAAHVAKFQGITANLTQFLSSPVIHAMTGYFYVRMNGRLEKIYIQDLWQVHRLNSELVHNSL